MKRYSHFFRSSATVSLSILYVIVTLFSPFLASAEEEIQEVLTVESTTEETSNDTSNALDSEVIFSVQDVDPHEKTVSEQELEIISEEKEEALVVSSERRSMVCDETNSPVITLKSYADGNDSDLNLKNSILSQISASAIDFEDGDITSSLENDIDTISLNPGWNEVTFRVADSDGCSDTKVVEVFIMGDSYSPVCDAQIIYVKFDIPENLSAVLGTNTEVQNGEWFPVSSTITENQSNITVPHNISIVRQGTIVSVEVFVTSEYLDNHNITLQEVKQNLVSSINVIGGTFTSIGEDFSGSTITFFFEKQDCPPVEVCEAPVLVSETKTVTIKENTTLTVEQILDLFNIVSSDLNTQVSSNLSSVNYLVSGEYNFTITLQTEGEDCFSEYTLKLIVTSDDDGGCKGRCGGGGGGRPPEEPKGEILGATTCTPYITTFMQMGQQNLKEDVIRLQTFLNQYMGEDLVVDGVYGSSTFEAVKRFQMHEFDEILKPWYITEPTGIVRETTMRHINNIMCPELNIQMPILYCATTGNLIYPDGTVLDPNPEYILYNGQPVIRKKVILPDWIIRKLEYPISVSEVRITQPNLPTESIKPDYRYEK